MVEDDNIFWLYASAKCPTLSTFARQLLNTIANSVPSERSWSTMNYIHSKTRNRLSLERVDKLLFIYINSRTLAKMNDYEPIEEQLVEYEARVLQISTLEHS
jgi:hAT family C-terminal dimerisation region